MAAAIETWELDPSEQHETHDEIREQEDQESKNVGGHSIFEYYSAQNELEFILAHRHLSPDELRYYLHENFTKFLGEFAGNIPYTTVTYTVEDNRVMYAGIDMIDMLDKTSRLTGTGSREDYENRGLIKSFKALAGSKGNPPVRSSVIISPNKGWGYNFTFASEREYNPELGRDVIKTRAIRRDETAGTLDTSRQQLHALDPMLDYNTAEEFLENPLVDLSHIESIDDILEKIGVSREDIQRSQLFEAAVEANLGAIIDEYVNGMMRFVVEGGSTQDQVVERIEDLNACIHTAFVIARDMKNELDVQTKRAPFTEIAHEKLLSSKLHFDSVNDMAAYADGREAYVDSGSCPVAYASIAELSQAVAKGIPVERYLEEKARSKIREKAVGRRLTNCPECGKTGVVLVAEEINNGILRCDNPLCLRSHSPLTANTQKDREGIYCVWDSAKPFMVYSVGQRY